MQKSKEDYQMKRLRIPVICVMVIVLSVLLSGCMKMHIDIVWNEDNSASLSMTVGVATYALSMMDMSEEEMQTQLRESFEEDMAGEDYTIKDFSDSEYTGITITVKIDDITKNTEDNLDHLKFTFDDTGGTKTYTVTGDFMDSDVMGDEADEFDVDSRITIVMPGRLRSHNATERSGNRLTWIQEDPNVAVQIYARSEGGGGLLWLWITIGAVVLVAGGVVAVLLVLKKKKASPQAGPYGSGPPAYGAHAQGYAHGQQPYAQQYQPQQPPPQQYQPQQPQQPAYVPPPAAPVQPQQPAYVPPPAPPAPVYEQPTPQQPAYVPPPAAPEPPVQPQQPAYVPLPAAPEPPVQPQQPAYVPPPAAPEPPPPPPPPAAPAARFCKNCGNALPEGTKFCPSCGTPA